jgi:hypothetical protein
MSKKLNFGSATLATAALMFGCVLANAQAPAPTPTPRNQPTQRPAPEPTAKPQNQSILNTTKSNVQDFKAVAPAPMPDRPRDRAVVDKGWDGKVLGRQLAEPTPTPRQNSR